MATVEEEGRPGSMAEILTATVHNAENDAVLAAEVASVQIEVFVRLVQSTNEVQRLTEGEELVVETVGVPMLGASEAPANIAPGPAETK
jgi:cellulose biosynthesis protein BcsQ